MNRPTNEVLGRLAFLANTRGIIPNPIDATRIDVAVVGVENTITILYTVPAGYKLFIDSLWLSLYNDSASTTTGALYIRNGSDVLVYYLAYLNLITKREGNHSQSFPVAVEVSAGYDICVRSFLAALIVNAGIHGWLESV